MKIEITIPSSTPESICELILKNVIESDTEVLLSVNGRDIYVLKEDLINAISKI